MTGTAVVRRARGRVPAHPSALRALRLARGWTQTELARRAGFRGGKGTIEGLEAEPRKLWARLIRLADVLGCSTDEVLGRTPPVPVVDALTRQDRELLDAMQRDAQALLAGHPILGQGWRRLARAAWLGVLYRIRDTGERRPQASAPALPPAPAGWHRGWWSARQEKKGSAR